MNEPVDDERHERAMQAVEDVLHDVLGPPDNEEAHADLADLILAALAEADFRLLYLPKCPECRGDGYTKAMTSSAYLAGVTEDEWREKNPCPSCGGTGFEQSGEPSIDRVADFGGYAYQDECVPDEGEQ